MGTSEKPLFEIGARLLSEKIWRLLVEFKMLLFGNNLNFEVSRCSVQVGRVCFYTDSEMAPEHIVEQSCNIRTF